MTEEDIRRIVREELAAASPAIVKVAINVSNRINARVQRRHIA